MKKTAVILGLMVCMVSSYLFAGTDVKDVAVVYNGVSGVNRKALEFIRSESRRHPGKFRFKPVDSGAGGSFDAFDAVIVLNTGLRGGIDPELESFIGRYDGSAKLILLSLYSGRNSVQVEYVPAGSQALGVDAVTAASRWGGGFFGAGSDVLKMHREWLNDVLDMVQG